MRKISYILTAILTFSISAAIYFCYLNFSVNRSAVSVAPVESSSLPIVSLCDAKNNYDMFDENEVPPEIRVKAKFIVREHEDKRIFELKKDCGNRFVQVRFQEEINEDLKRLVKQLQENSSEELTAFAEVEAVGELEFSGIICNFVEQRPFYFRVKEFRQISPIKQINLDEELKKLRNR